MKSALSEVRRARPLLGTFVEITVQGADEAYLHAAVEEAFAAVCAVHRLMNFHDPASDVGRLNAGAARNPLRVHPWTRRVLLAAGNFARETGGAFDITAAASGRNQDLQSGKSAGKFCGDWRDIILSPNGSVSLQRPLLIDLGGIAKGFAVDRATEALIRAGAHSGVINAGGDLRVFGPEPHRVDIRHPLDPGRRARRIVLRDGSIATFRRSKRPGGFCESRPIPRRTNRQAHSEQDERNYLRARLHDGGRVNEDRAGDAPRGASDSPKTPGSRIPVQRRNCRVRIPGRI